MSQSVQELSSPRANLLSRRIPKPSHRHAAPAGWVVHSVWLCGSSDLLSRPWPYIDSLADQESEEVIDAKIPAVIGSCGHGECDDCKTWTAYPQSHFGNWTIKPVRKCGIAGAVENKEHSSTIFTVDVLANGVFGDSGKFLVTSENKREYYNNTLLPDVSAIQVLLFNRV